MFSKDPRGYYRSSLLDQLPWLDHGFATRAAQPYPAELTTVKQIHSALVLRAEGPAGVQGEADGIVTGEPGRALAVKTADCLPVLIADRRLRVIAAVHAGWRGVAHRIVPETIRVLRDLYGSSSGDLAVAAGPGIGCCCFEVGPEVAAEFGRQGRVHLDLLEIVREQLHEEGVADSQFDAARLCTRHQDQFHSFRRDREQSGRMLSVIALRK